MNTDRPALRDLVAKWRAWNYKQHRDEHRAGTRDMMIDQGIEDGLSQAADELEAELDAHDAELPSLASMRADHGEGWAAALDREPPFDHRDVFEAFFRELWATMVDPLEEPPSFTEGLATVLQQAREQRERMEREQPALTDAEIEAKADAAYPPRHPDTDMRSSHWHAFVYGARWARDNAK